MMRKLLSFTILLFFAVIIMSCIDIGYDSYSYFGFITKNYTKSIDGYVQFKNEINPSRNDHVYHVVDGFIFPSPLYQNTSTGTPNIYQIEIIKIAGSEMYTEYGMIFAAQDDSYYTVTISDRNNGTVEIRENRFISPDSGNSSRLHIKNNSTEINKGFDVINTLKAVKNGNSYDVFINEKLIFTINQNNNEMQGVRIGFWTTITSTNERLVDIRFRIK